MTTSEIPISGKDLPEETLVRTLYAAKDIMLERGQNSPQARPIYTDLPTPPAQWLMQLDNLTRSQQATLNFGLGIIQRNNPKATLKDLKNMSVAQLADAQTSTSRRLGEVRARKLKEIFG